MRVWVKIEHLVKLVPELRLNLEMSSFKNDISQDIETTLSDLISY
jgi:hypothetical protein